MPIQNTRKRWIVGVVALAAAGGLGGCADYLNHSDYVTFAAPDAQNSNIAIQTMDPWPPASRRTLTGGDGKRVEKVTERYTNPPPPQELQKQSTVNVNIGNSN